MKFPRINWMIEEKMEYFREAIKSAEGIKGKPLGEYIRMSKVEAQGDTLILLRANNLEHLGIFFRFCYRATTQLGFQVLGY